jgi:hypothetical protein
MPVNKSETSRLPIVIKRFTLKIVKVSKYLMKTKEKRT